MTLGAITALGTLPNSISGTAALSTNFDHTPNLCSTGYAATGVTAHGDATGVRGSRWRGTGHFSNMQRNAGSELLNVRRHCL